MNIDNVAFGTEVSSLKDVLSGSGVISSPYATSSSSPASNIVTIPHNQMTNNVIPSVTINTQSVFGRVGYSSLPWSTRDGRTSVDVYVDDTNIYIKASSFTAGMPQDPQSFAYTYIVLIP